ncbi:MAG: peptidylprolyl isomerase [Piscirickettsiaceae bacterium]|nr:MAG: peptidylprolyl isomerase [Piscirickettsiaceae bacterium]PCI66476.1 MAG: peptidylprolyl isomerase [Piscirickettsiaceae bacterium]
MMESLRAHVKGWLGMVIIAGISLSFILVGLQSYTGDGSEAPLAEVADRKIYQSDVNNAYRQRVAQLKEQYADQYSPDLFSEEALRNDALNQLVQEQLILHTVDTDGYAVSDQAVLDVIGKLDAFQTDGQFDKNLYEELLQAKGLTSAGFVQQVKVGLVRDQFVRGIVDTTLVDDSEIDDFYRLNNQVRDIEYITLPLADYIDKVLVSAEELQKNYQQNEHLYKIPEQVSVDYVELSLASLMAEMNPVEAELKAFYEGEKESFTVEGRRRASHILFEAPDGTMEKESEAKRKLAEDVLLQIQQGGDFIALAKEYSDDIGSAKKGGDLGIINKGMMDDMFEDALSQLTVNQVSEVTRTPYGFHIIKLTELEETKVQSYGDAKEKVLLSFKQQVAGEKFYQLSERLAELSFENPESLDVLVDELGLVIKHLDLFAQDSGVGVAANDKVRHAAFTEDFLVGNNSEVVELEPEHLLVLHLSEHKPASTKSFDDVKAAVELSVRQHKAGVELKAKADALLQDTVSSKVLKVVAEKNDIPLTVAGPITRNDKTVPQTLIRDVFSMSHPVDNQASFRTSTIENGDIIIVSLNKITDGKKMDIDDKSRDSFKKFLARLKGEVTLAAALANLSVGADVVFANKPR